MIQIINLLSIVIASLGVLSYMLLMLRHRNHMDYVLFSTMMAIFLISILETQNVVEHTLMYMSVLRILYAIFIFRLLLSALLSESKTTQDLLKSLKIIKKPLTWERLYNLPMNRRLYVKEIGLVEKTHQDLNQISFTAILKGTEGSKFISEFDKIFFVQTGSCTIDYNKRVYTLKEGEALKVPSKKEHCLTSPSGCTMTIVISN